jgi:phage anti-repressor protein
MELIKISNENGKKTVNAIDLHSFLGSGQKFSDWIKNRVEQYSFIEGQDFTINLGKSTGGRPTQDYHLSLDMAKELSMVERNEKGKQARQYFIECEKKANTLPAISGDVLTASLQAMLSLRQTQVAHEMKLQQIEQKMESIVLATDKTELKKGQAPCGYENKGDVLKTVARLTGVTQEIVKLCLHTFSDSIAKKTYVNEIIEGDKVVNLQVVCYYVIDVISAVKKAEKECYHVTEHFAIFPSLNNKKMKYKKPCHL